jgi:hypothetical protein
MARKPGLFKQFRRHEQAFLESAKGARICISIKPIDYLKLL